MLINVARFSVLKQFRPALSIPLHEPYWNTSTLYLHHSDQCPRIHYSLTNHTNFHLEAGNRWTFATSWPFGAVGSRTPNDHEWRILRYLKNGKNSISFASIASYWLSTMTTILGYCCFAPRASVGPSSWFQVACGYLVAQFVPSPILRRRHGAAAPVGS